MAFIRELFDTSISFDWLISPLIHVDDIVIDASELCAFALLLCNRVCYCIHKIEIYFLDDKGRQERSEKERNDSDFNLRG